MRRASNPVDDRRDTIAIGEHRTVDRTRTLDRSARSATPTKVLIVEEYTVVRRGVRLLLETVPELEVAGEASTLAEAKEVPFDPGLVVHELLLPDGSGPQVIPDLRARFPEAKLLVLSRLDHPGYVHMAMTQGARGYVTKSAVASELLSAVTTVAEGGEYVEPALGVVLARWDAINAHRGHTPWAELTRREAEVAELVALGYTSTEIAKALGIAPRTVDTHRAHIGQKLGTSSRADIVRFVESRQRESRAR